MTTRGIGLDFGTTNSAIAIARPGEAARVARFASTDGPTASFRSILYCGREHGRAEVESVAGPRAIDRYLEIEDERRLMQSLKSFLASRLFKATNVFGRNTTLEELIGRIASDLRRESGTDPSGSTVVVGRPVHFAKARSDEDDEYAVSRLTEALGRAGFDDVRFEFEPVAAAHHYERSLERDELVLIADFGGGTSDFCLLPVGPSWRGRTRVPGDILGTDGVAVAGDAFDAKIVRHVVAPHLGKGSEARAFLGEPMRVPAWIYGDLERWHHLSFLRSRKTLALLHEIACGAAEPDKIEALIHVVQHELGFQLYQAVEHTKLALSQHEASAFVFDDPPVRIASMVARRDFEEWIADDVATIAEAVDRLLASTGTASERVDRVFMTGGSSFVPAVRRVFEDRFGAERIRSGGELISVASGLALLGL